MAKDDEISFQIILKDERTNRRKALRAISTKNFLVSVVAAFLMAGSILYPLFRSSF
jgi:hypothetical protein